MKALRENNEVEFHFKYVTEKDWTMLSLKWKSKKVYNPNFNILANKLIRNILEDNILFHDFYYAYKIVSLVPMNDWVELFDVRLSFTHEKFCLCFDRIIMNDKDLQTLLHTQV